MLELGCMCDRVEVDRELLTGDGEGDGRPRLRDDVLSEVELVGASVATTVLEVVLVEKVWRDDLPAEETESIVDVCEVLLLVLDLGEDSDESKLEEMEEVREGLTDGPINEGDWIAMMICVDVVVETIVCVAISLLE